MGPNRSAIEKQVSDNYLFPPPGSINIVDHVVHGVMGALSLFSPLGSAISTSVAMPSSPVAVSAIYNFFTTQQFKAVVVSSPMVNR